MRTIGSISTDTLRDEDIAQALIGELESIKMDPDHGLDKPERRNLRDGVQGTINDLCALWNDDDQFILDGEINGDVIGDAFDVLQHFAPAFCTFGMHPDDGAAMGYWPDYDQIEMLQRVSDPSELPTHVADAATSDGFCNYERAHVNDHGNVTVYRPRVVWDPVLEIV